VTKPLHKNAIAICQKNELWSLIKKVSNSHGGDDPEWLKEYAKSLVENYSLEECLLVFRDLASQCQVRPDKTENMTLSKPITYQPPFVVNT